MIAAFMGDEPFRRGVRDYLGKRRLGSATSDDFFAALADATPDPANHPQSNAEIIVLAVYDRLPRLEVKFTRRNVFLRDKFTCQYCTKVLPETQLNLDHVTPRDKGGRTTWDNIVTSCFRCNTRKGNKLPEEAGLKLLRRPSVPREIPVTHLIKNHHRVRDWEMFLAGGTGVFEV